MVETRPTVYPCMECGYSHRIVMCVPRLARHNGVTMQRCRRCEAVTEHRVFHMAEPTPEGHELDACGGRCS